MYGRIILKWIFKKWDGGGGMDWIDLAQNSKRRWAVVNEVMNFWVLQSAEKFLSSSGAVRFSRRAFVTWS
jgi:hypothetical protein